jgi:hypothetical protein
MFLTADEVAILTGIKRGRNGKSGYQLQAEQLRRMGLPFFVNACSRPIVTRVAVEGGRAEPAKAEKKWVPAVLRKEAAARG